MNTLPITNEESPELPEEQTGISKTMKLVLAGLISLGVLDAYDDYRSYAAEGQSAHVNQSHK